MLREPFFGKDITRLILCFCFLGGSEGDWLGASEIRRDDHQIKVSIFENVSRSSTVLIVIDGVELDDISEGTGDWGLALSLVCFALGGTIAIVPGILNGLWGRFRSFSLVGYIGSCFP